MPAGFALAVLGVFAVLAVLGLLAVLDVAEGRAGSARRDVDVVVPEVPASALARSGATMASVSWTGLFGAAAPLSEDAGADDATVAAGADPVF